MRLQNTIVLSLVTVSVFLILSVGLSGLAKESTGGEPKALAAGKKIYDESCASCHPGGGNIISPRSPVKGSPRMASQGALKAFLEKPTASMPPFPAIAGNDTDMSNLYAYAKTLK